MTGDLFVRAEELADRIEQADARVHAFVAERDRRGRLRAEVEALGDGSLHGVFAGVKDVFHAAGLETRAGSELPPDVLAGPEATAVARLKRAGALVAGKTVTAEFAFQAPGPTVNPHDPTRTPGGSSSGSAAAVAMGLVPLALGTQTIGSVIRPAAYCGVVGFKPTYGRIPVDGVIANAPSLDTVGVLAADLDITERAAAALCDAWTPAPDASVPVLGVPAGPYLALATEAAREQLARLGVRDVPVLEDLDEVIAHNTTVNLYELARVHHDWFEKYGDRYREQTAAGIRAGQKITADDYSAALRAKAAHTATVIARMDEAGIDAWIAPAATGPAPDLSTTGSPLMSLPWTFAGLPAVALPTGQVDGLPVGLQLIARPGDDEHLLAWARMV